MPVATPPAQMPQWAQAWLLLLQLGVPTAQLILVFKSLLTPEDYAKLLATLKAGWQAAKDENDARIAELERQTAGG